MFNKTLVAHLLILFIALASTVSAQTTGSIRGVVTDTDEQPLPGATVTISSETLIGQTRITYTNEAGLFRFPSLPIGTYSIQITMEGYESVQVAKAEVSLYSTTVIPIQMKFATKVESITVVGETPMVDVSDSGFSITYNNELLREVPTQRSMTDLMQVAPGMSPGIGDSQSETIVAFGSNLQSNSWNIDGLDTANPELGILQWSVNPDLIQEIQVIGVGAPAEFGNHLGGVFNVVTKKGGNQFHGGANNYYQNDSLTGTNVELNPERFYCGTECNSFHLLKYNNISSQLGGPIVKDRLSFFGGFEYFRYQFSNPGQDPAFAPTSKRDRYDIKLSGNLGEHETNAFFHYEKWDIPWDQFLRFEPSALPNDHGSNPAWGAGWTSTLSNNFLLEINYSGWWADFLEESSTGSLNDPFIDRTPGNGNYLYSGGIVNPHDNVTLKNQLKAKASYYAENFLKSEHEFKFGVQYAYGSVLNNRAIGPNGFYTYSVGDKLYRAYQDPFQYGAINNDLGFFVDDTVHVNNKLTLNLGLRFDHNTGKMPEFEILTSGQPSISPVGNFKETGKRTSEISVLNWNLISPRLGAVYQLRDDARSIIQGSFGVYYDHSVSGNWDYPAPGFSTFAKFKLNPVTERYDTPLPDPIRPEDVSINSDLRSPRTLQYAIGYEHQIGQSMAFGTQYVYKTTKDLVGWEILGGRYDEVPFLDPLTGKQLILLSITDNPIFQKGNDPGNFPGAENLDYFQKYHGLVFTFDKRFSNNWSFAASYTWSRSTGLIPITLFQGQGPAFAYFFLNEGKDPNNYINAEGFLQNDRPHMFRAMSYIENLPFGLHASVNTDFSSGKHHVRTAITDQGLLSQGRIAVIMQRGYRISPIEMIDLMIGRRFDISGFVVRVDGTIFNLLNSDNELGVNQTLEKAGAEFGGFNWTHPRRLQLRLGFEF